MSESREHQGRERYGHDALTRHDLHRELEWLVGQLKQHKPLGMRLIVIDPPEDMPTKGNMDPLIVNIATPLPAQLPGGKVKRQRLNFTFDAAFDPTDMNVEVIAGDSTGTFLAGVVQPDGTVDLSDKAKATAYVNADGSLGAKEIDFTADPHPGEGEGAGRLVVKVTYTVAGPESPDATTVTVEQGPVEDVPTPAVAAATLAASKKK